MYIYIYIYIHIHISLTQTHIFQSILTRTRKPCMTTETTKCTHIFYMLFAKSTFKEFQNTPESKSYMNNAEYLKTTQLLLFKGFHLKRTSPHGDLKQETCRKHPVLLNAAARSCKENTMFDIERWY